MPCSRNFFPNLKEAWDPGWDAAVIWFGREEKAGRHWLARYDPIN
jgi:hypothetical protein